MSSRHVAIDGGFEPIFKLRTLIDFWQLFTGAKPPPSRLPSLSQLNHDRVWLTNCSEFSIRPRLNAFMQRAGVETSSRRVASPEILDAFGDRAGDASGRFIDKL